MFRKELEQDDKRDETINKIRRLQALLHKFIVTFT